MSRYCLDLDTPATGFMDSFLIGNGALGASLRGVPGSESFALNLDTVWSGGPLQPEAGEGPAHLMPALRDAILRRDYLLADRLARQVQGGRYTQSYQPLGTVRFDYADDAVPAEGGYLRRLDMGIAEAQTRSGGATLDSFASHPDGVIVAHAHGKGIRSLSDVGLAFELKHPNRRVGTFSEGQVRWLVAAGRVPVNVMPDYVGEVAEAVTYGTDEPDAGGTVAAGMGIAVAAAVVAEPDGGLRLVIAAASGYRGFDKRPSADLDALVAEARGRVTAALRRPIADLRARHRADYRALFDRVDLDLSGSPATAGADPSAAERMFHFGRYLLISASRAGTQAANLQGIWNVDVRPAWSCNYTVNINTQMNYWPAELAGLGELHRPMLDLTRELAIAGRATARRHYGAAGSTAHHNADLWRFTAPVPGRTQWSNWPSALYWLAAHLQEHVDHGMAEPGFVDTHLRPVLADCAAFALDMLVEGPDGELVASPSTSPEHSFVPDGATEVAVTAGSAMDQELIREVLTNYCAIADDELAARSRDALLRLRVPVIGAGGNLLEWDDDKVPAELGHRHLSHLYGLFPGRRITEIDTPAEFLAVREALRLRLTNGTGYTGWSQAWVLCLAARLRDADSAEQSIAGLIDTLASRSLLVLHPHTRWAEGYVFQIDGNFGAVAGLTELLVQSHDGAISLLRTVPASWTEGSIREIRCRGGDRAGVTWRAGAIVEATIAHAGPGPLVVELPAAAYRFANGEGKVVTASAQAEELPGRIRFSFDTSDPLTLLVRPA